MAPLLADPVAIVFGLLALFVLVDVGILVRQTRQHSRRSKLGT